MVIDRIALFEKEILPFKFDPVVTMLILEEPVTVIPGNEAAA